MLFLLLWSIGLYAQEPPRVANYMQNQLVFNPASAGMHETQLNASLISRLQWTDFDGAPVSHLMWMDCRFPKNKTALGLNIQHDRYGIYRNTDVLLNYAYSFNLSPKTKLSMGLRAGAGMLRYDASVLKNVWDSDDLYHPENSTALQATLPKAGFGLQLNSGNLYAGLSAPDLIVVDQNDVLGNKDRSFFQKRRNYLAMGGYKLKLNNSYALFPNAMIAYYTFSGWRADISLIGEITDYFWAGATYSTSHTYSLMAGTHISSRIRFSYAYQFRIGKDLPILMNTHEVNLLLNLHGLIKSKK